MEKENNLEVFFGNMKWIMEKHKRISVTLLK